MSLSLGESLKLESNLKENLARLTKLEFFLIELENKSYH